ncbi:MAG: hypothetical protein JW834_01695 [Candidatus Diapherotrites archaeon]|nr:hypothetical protein [Candidatus Diapherotrites archaeon]
MSFGNVLSEIRHDQSLSPKERAELLRFANLPVSRMEEELAAEHLTATAELSSGPKVHVEGAGGRRQLFKPHSDIDTQRIADLYGGIAQQPAGKPVRTVMAQREGLFTSLLSALGLGRKPEPTRPAQVPEADTRRWVKRTMQEHGLTPDAIDLMGGHVGEYFSTLSPQDQAKVLRSIVKKLGERAEPGSGASRIRGVHA